MEKPVTYMGNGFVSIGETKEPAHYTLAITTSANGIKSGSGGFTGKGDLDAMSGAEFQQREAILTLATGETVAILVQKGDPLARQFKFVTNGAIPALPQPPSRRSPYMWGRVEQHVLDNFKQGMSVAEINEKREAFYALAADMQTFLQTHYREQILPEERELPDGSRVLPTFHRPKSQTPAA